MNEPFFDAVAKGQTPRMLLLLKSGLDVNTRNSEGMTALMLAAKKGHTDTVQALLDREADINAQATYYGWTALAYAANQGHEQIVRLLLARGADPNLKAERGKTALVLAADRGHTTTVIALLNKGANACAARDHHGWTALGRAVRNGHIEVEKVLRDAGAEGA